jgi:two-component system, OmpR family, phosphate regulon response regulator OmpR
VNRGGTGSLARVLVADDEPGIRRAMESSLTRAGFDVTVVDDGAPAIALAEHTAFDIVLVDVHMKTSGLAVVRHYKRCYGPRVYCAVLSGADDDEVRGACLEAGADEVLVKPIPAAVLRRRLSEAVLALRATALAG